MLLANNGSLLQPYQVWAVLHVLDWSLHSLSGWSFIHGNVSRPRQSAKFGLLKDGYSFVSSCEMIYSGWFRDDSALGSLKVETLDIRNSNTITWSDVHEIVPTPLRSCQDCQYLQSSCCFQDTLLRWHASTLCRGEQSVGNPWTTQAFALAPAATSTTATSPQLSFTSGTTPYNHKPRSIS